MMWLRPETSKKERISYKIYRSVTKQLFLEKCLQKHFYRKVARSPTVDFWKQSPDTCITNIVLTKKTLNFVQSKDTFLIFRKNEILTIQIMFQSVVWVSMATEDLKVTVYSFKIVLYEEVVRTKYLMSHNWILIWRLIFIKCSRHAWFASMKTHMHNCTWNNTDSTHF